MITSVTVPRKYVRTQATAPASAIEGDLWFNTTTDTFYSYNGSSWDILSTDVSPIIQNTAENNIEIIELQANASVTPISHDTLISETFSDADGYNNLVNTGNTNSIFDTNKYKYYCGYSDSAEKTRNTTSYLLVKTFDSFPNSYFTKHTNELKTDNSDHQSICKVEWTYTDDSTEYVEQQTNSTGFISKEYTNPFPAKLVKIVKVYLKSSSAVIAREKNDEASGVAPDGTIIEIDLPAITGTITATQLVCNCPERETGDAVKYKLIDTASAEDDALEIDTENALVNCDGTKITGGKIQIQLIPKETSPTSGYPSCRSFALKLWKS